MYRAIPNAALWIVPGGDHVPIYDPAVAFTATALQFLDHPGR
jgi:pimeloyl-ACP methyl ester carboxylesterase